MSYLDIGEDELREISDRYYQDFNICKDIYPRMFKMKGIMFGMGFESPIPTRLIKKIMDLMYSYEI